MAEGKEKAAWWHTAQQVAALVNVHRARHAPIVTAAQFHPYFAKAEAQANRLTKKRFDALWTALGGK